VAFVPGEAAFLDGRGRNAMRLNFSGSDEDAIREGIRRIGEVVTEQVELYGTLTGEHTAVRVEDRPAVEDPADDNVLRLPNRSARSRRAEGS
jgi:2-aminoadipate transaminase